MGISKRALSVLDGLSYDPDVIKRDRAQSVFSLTFLDFQARLINESLRGSGERDRRNVHHQLTATEKALAKAGWSLKDVDLMLEAPMEALRAKSVRQMELFDALLTQQIGADTFALISPRAPEMRGSQLCYAHEHGWPIMRALIDRGVIGDFRAPDILRFGFTPLYLRYADVWNAVATLEAILAERAWDHPKFHERVLVT